MNPININTPVSAIPTQPNGATYTPYGAAGNAAISNAQSAITPPVQSQPQAPAQKGNWFTHLLPTLGSIAAPLIGTALAPETGGLSLLASLALAGGGSAAGKAAEDVAQKQSVNPTGLLESAAEGAGGQALGAGVGGVLGKIVGKATGGLANAVEGRATQAAIDEGAQTEAKAATDAATAKTNEIQRLADEFKPQVNDKSLTPSIGGVVNGLNDLGIEKPVAQDAVKVGNVFTGENDNGAGILNQEKQNVLANAGGTVHLGNPNEVGTPSGNLLANLRDPSSISRLDDPLSEGSSPARAILDKYEVLAKGAGVPAEGASDIDPTKAFSLLSDVSDEARAAAKSATKISSTPADVQISNAWDGLKNDLKDAIYNRPEVNDAVSKYQVTPEISGQIDKKITAEGITDPTVASNLKQKIVDTLNNGQTMQDWLTEEAQGVKMSQVGKSALAQQGNITSAASQRLAKGNVQIPDSPDTVPVKTNTTSAIPLGHGISSIIPHIIQAAKNPENQAMVNKLLQSGVSKKIASAIPLALTGASQFVTHAGDSTPTPVNLNLGNNSMQPQSGLDPNSLNSLLLQLASSAIANNNSAGSTLMGQILPGIQNSNVAQNALTSTENAFQQAGGGQGGIIGNLSKVLGGITGNPASQYEQQRAQLINQLNTLGVPTSAVPDITGNNQSAQTQFQGLQNMINAKMNGGSVLNSLPAAQ